MGRLNITTVCPDRLPQIKQQVLSSPNFVVTMDGYNAEPHFISDKEDAVNISTLIGKKVVCYTKGYMEQYHADEFVIGKVAPAYESFNAGSVMLKEFTHEQLIAKYGYHIITEDDLDTCIFIDNTTCGVFCCTDSDRPTIFALAD